MLVTIYSLTHALYGEFYHVTNWKQSYHVGIEFGESDLNIVESSTRQIFVRRQNNIGSSMSLTVFVTTIEGYRQRLQTGCNITLSTLLGSQVDPAEGR